ncbi:RNA polymerase sigma factor [Parabacteroides chinchillae]|uniref:RNA polymerase sigma-70 factor, ECF subfamily n=1 Tax=Parabacteroides chinchillae TaxID=871327 RepID=A0A8G2F1E8_9BACT|nr:sigma-70 family RNA polymerase sigma factor [Parabacteroides chinchillae]SEF40090.1 RNA polymerase sigma-70 factor, ECF subfamily [Parabacteroides chinchillae]
MSESEVTDRCRVGDNQARKELYELYAEKMLCLCYRYAGDIDVAHDLLHDGFLKVFSSISSFTYKGEGSLRAWLSRVFANTALEYLRRKDLLRQGISLDEVYDLPNEPEPDACNLSMDILMRFVTDLPYGYRTVFNLFVFEHWSHKEIAAQLHINEKSSASQLNRARKILATRIREELKRIE